MRLAADEPRQQKGEAMTSRRLAVTQLGALTLLAACASTEITSHQAYQGPKLPRPGRILVEDFAATPAEIPPGSPLAAQLAPATPPSTAELDVARQLGVAIATELVADLKAMGLPAARAADQPPPQVNDIVIRGYFVSVDEGSATKRMTVGFGAGAAELKTALEGYRMTPQGLQRLGSGQVTAGSGKVPGALAPLAVVVASGNPIGLIVNTAAKAQGESSGRETIQGAAKRTADEISTQLRPKFEQQGWI